MPPRSTTTPDAAINHTHSIAYWNSVSSDINGMLGGFPQTSRIDLQGSSTFLTKLRRKHHQTPKPTSHKTVNTPTPTLEPLDRVADCGAGIGRITKGFLLNVAKRVDVVEPVEKFTNELVASLDGEEQNSAKGQIGEIINLGLQDWTPSPHSYNIIWNQWCLGHLTDTQLIAYLRRCAAGLITSSSSGKPEAWIIVKENVASDSTGMDIYDDEDSSVTRTEEKWLYCFKEAGLRVVSTEVQKGFPKDLFAVRMWALRPE